ncbi:hypothetical protein Anapl_02222 [Anas platyrhynchos]|uniref:Uncharacterized protein n=1 Tax=Anas platyrhynchos TaxID=8839 RepID=R0LD04_ANAPL|nr:hypothetical protein Anapl_02222 [Anas platyrhynchos]
MRWVCSEEAVGLILHGDVSERPIPELGRGGGEAQPARSPQGIGSGQDCCRLNHVQEEEWRDCGDEEVAEQDWWLQTSRTDAVIRPCHLVVFLLLAGKRQPSLDRSQSFFFRSCHHESSSSADRKENTAAATAQGSEASSMLQGHGYWATSLLFGTLPREKQHCASAEPPRKKAAQTETETSSSLQSYHNSYLFRTDQNNDKSKKCIFSSCEDL